MSLFKETREEAKQKLEDAKDILGKQVVINELLDALDRVRGAGTLNCAFIIADKAIEKFRYDQSRCPHCVPDQLCPLCYEKDDK